MHRPLRLSRFASRHQERAPPGLLLSSSDPPTEIAYAKEDGPQPVSIVQERMLRIERKLPGLPQFNLPFAYRLQGPLNVLALERSLARSQRRHDSLRTAFTWRDEVLSLS